MPHYTEFTGLFQLQIASQYLRNGDPHKYVEKIKAIQLYCDELIQTLQTIPGQDRNVQEQLEWIEQLNDQLRITEE